jgi:chemotaxis protein CheX
MDVKHINAFVSGLLNVSNMLGINDIKRTGLAKNESLKTDNDVNIIIGLVGDLRGNVVLSLQEATACNIASKMMGGVPVEQFDLMPKSALCEMANMIAGNSVSNLEQAGSLVDITPPTLVNGRNMISMISQVETIIVQFAASEGTIAINISLE